ncbi:F-box/kelch-repeat protein At3g06240-like [Papaver somniferum]|uniref:F-box/kelch-repeat protein At3g06240-like n=1 Tax=Papaver somniferum TaxID=3469 RepID=UPI000E7008BA|nr:F-box/kelch-repeat protein At3g06240-like [Papaver somniferum]
MVVETKLPDDTFIKVSCDGLIGCLLTGTCNGDTLHKICLWNPLTGEYRNVSTPTSSSNQLYDSFSNYGVCYDWKIDDYKLFLIVVNDSACSEVWVCRLGSNSWESTGFIPYDISPYNICLTPLNGIIHWIGYTKVIFSFDIVEGRNKEIQLPPCYLNDKLYLFQDMEVGVLRENLYLSVNATCKSNIDLWVMKDYGVADSWRKFFSISTDETLFDSLWPLHYLENNHKILFHGYVNTINDEDSGEAVLVSYDLINGELMTLDIPYKPKHFYPIIFVGSLVSLNSCELVEAKQISEVA